MSLPSRPHDNDLTRAGWVVFLVTQGALLFSSFKNTRILSSLFRPCPETGAIKVSNRLGDLGDQSLRG